VSGVLVKPAPAVRKLRVILSVPGEHNDSPQRTSIQPQQPHTLDFFKRAAEACLLLAALPRVIGWSYLIEALSIQRPISTKE
jgi:hypothetical protein